MPHRRRRAARADVADDDAADARDDRADASAAARLPACALAWRGHEVWRLPGWRGSFVFSPVAAHEHDAVPEALLSSAALRACARAGGERMRTRQGGPGRTLKNLFQERGVPAWQRDVPLLYVGERLLFVPRIGVNRATHDGADAPGGWRRIEWRPDMLIA